MLDRVLREHRDDGLDRLLPDRPLLVEIDAERLQLGDAGALAGAELDAAVRDEVERGDALGAARRVRRRQLHDAVAQADVLGPLAGRAEKHLRGRRVRVFLKEMVLDLPGIVVAEPVGQFDLIERVLIEPMLAARLATGAAIAARKICRISCAILLRTRRIMPARRRPDNPGKGTCRPIGGTGCALPMPGALRTYRLTLSRSLSGGTRASEVRDGDEAPGRKTVPPALLYRRRMGRRDRPRDDPGHRTRRPARRSARCRRWAPRRPAARSRRPTGRLPAWRAKTAKERAQILRNWFDLMMANQDDLGDADDRRAGQAAGRGEGRDRLCAPRSSNGSPRRPSASTATRSRRTAPTSASSSSRSRSASAPRSRRGTSRPR